ncbi:MAG: hydroxyacid dehydrogenase [Proteobacteria bacterium]|nr:MAG: hydroxyacid dehydrogenase [Pseudomonadota bacterium]
MAPALTTELMTDAHRARLAAIADVPDAAPLARFDDARAGALLPQAEILLTGWGSPRIDAALLARAPKLRAVVHAAGTVKGHVDPDVLARGVRVSSAAAANAVPVAEFTVAAILLAGKRAFRLQRLYREVRGFRMWPREVPAIGNYGKTVGVVGASRIGRLVLERLRAFDFALLLHDPFVSAAEAASLGAEWVEIDDLLRRSDVVSLHAPSLPATRHLIDARRLALLRDGAVFVNTARGALVDGDALAAELASGRIDAVIDTTDPEILPAESPLYDLPNVFLTPHVAGAMGAETQRLATLAIDEIERLAQGAPLAHEVRLADWERIA